MIEAYPNFNLEVYLLENEIEYKIHDSEGHTEFAINCTECVRRGEPREDTKNRCWINTKTGAFYCYNCHWRGGIEQLVKSISAVDSTGAFRIIRGDLMDPMEHMSLKLIPETFEPDLDADGDMELREVTLPYGYKPIVSPHEYLEERGIPWEYAMENEWGFSEVGYVRDRIIVPTYMEEKLVFWQARATWDEPGNKAFKKVLNPKGVSARSVLFNYDKAKVFETIVIVEGFIDAVKTGPNAVATNGKTLHSKQLEWLRRTDAKNIILMWDAGSWLVNKKAKRKLPSILDAEHKLKMFFDVKLVKMPSDIDPGDLPMRGSEINELISSAKKYTH